MNDEWKAYELTRRQYPSVAFYEAPPVKQTSTVIMAIIFIVLTIAVVIVIYLLWRNRKKSCVRAPETPSDVSAGFLSVTQFMVQWKGVDAAESYTVYVGQNSGFLRARSVNVTTTTRTRATITGLTLNRTYYIVVTATNSCGESLGSDEITFVYVEL